MDACKANGDIHRGRNGLVPVAVSGMPADAPLASNLDVPMHDSRAIIVMPTAVRARSYFRNTAQDAFLRRRREMVNEAASRVQNQSFDLRIHLRLHRQSRSSTGNIKVSVPCSTYALLG